MIFSSFQTGDSLVAYPAAIRRALEFLKTTDIEALKPGDYPIDGEKIFAKVFDLTTLPVSETHPEIHKRYIDVQYWPAGSERFGIAPYFGSEEIVDAREAEDLYFLASAADESFVIARPGCFAVFFPWDAHRPGTVLDAPATFRKCVVKVRTDLLGESNRLP